MAKVEITHNTEKNAADIAQWLDNNLEPLLKRKVRQDHFALQWDEGHRNLTFSGRMAKGVVAVSDKQIVCTIIIPILLRPFSGQIKAAVADALADL